MFTDSFLVHFLGSKRSDKDDSLCLDKVVTTNEHRPPHKKCSISVQLKRQIKRLKVMHGNGNPGNVLHAFLPSSNFLCPSARI